LFSAGQGDLQHHEQRGLGPWLPILGDANTGPHRTFTQVPGPGYDAGLSTTHTETMCEIAGRSTVKGAYLYKSDERGEKPRGRRAISCASPEAQSNWSGGATKEGAMFYAEGYGKFELIPARVVAVINPSLTIRRKAGANRFSSPRGAFGRLSASSGRALAG